MELGKNATDELYSSSKWPFLQANMKINLILDYWDARNSLLYNLITSFIDGVTLKLAQPHHNIDRVPRKSKKTRGELPKRIRGNKISKFEPVATTDSSGVSSERFCLRDLTWVTLKSVTKCFFENDGIG